MTPFFSDNARRYFEKFWEEGLSLVFLKVLKFRSTAYGELNRDVN
jgi:hypothetical protein